jgi:hypothetical protein
MAEPAEKQAKMAANDIDTGLVGNNSIPNSKTIDGSAQFSDTESIPEHVPIVEPRESIDSLSLEADAEVFCASVIKKPDCFSVSYEILQYFRNSFALLR